MRIWADPGNLHFQNLFFLSAVALLVSSIISHMFRCSIWH